MKTLLTLSVLTGSVVSLFRSSSYSYSYGSPYYSSSSYYYSDNYYTTPYRSNSRYSSNEYKSYTYMDGSSRPTVSKEDLARAARNQADSTRVIKSSQSFTAGKLRYYWGSQYLPSQECGSNIGKRSKRQALPYTTTPYFTTVSPKSVSPSNAPPLSTTPWNLAGFTTTYPPNGRTTTRFVPYSNYNGTTERQYTPTTRYFTPTERHSTDGDYWNDTVYYSIDGGDTGNFSEYKDILAYMNMFYVNFTDPAEKLNYVETYLPDNFTSKTYSNSSSMMNSAMSSLPLNISGRVNDLTQSMMNGNVSQSADDWFNDMKDEQTYKDLINNSNGSGPVQTNVGCSENSAKAVCTRSISDLDSTLYSYVFESAVPNEIAWQCPDKDYYCCEWECCKEKKWSVAGIIFAVLFCFLAFSCCVCMCCLCIRGKEKEKETLVVMYPKPQPQAYFISVPPRVYY